MIYKGREAMMCAQFAYHCYKEAGKNYEIHMKGTTRFNVIDQIIEIIRKDPSKFNSRLFLLREEHPAVTDENVEDAINKLYEELAKEQNQSQFHAANELSEDFIIEVTCFCIRFVKTFLKEADCDKNDAVFYLVKLKDMYEYFISPGDLLENTWNLTCIGTVDYEG